MKIQPKKNGFTLIEVLIAILVFSIGMLGLIKLQGEITLNSAESRMYTHAVNLAQDKIEEFRNYTHQATYTAYASDANGTDIDVVGASAATFTRTWVVTNNPGYKEVEVTVNWVGLDGQDNNVVLTSQLAEVEPSRSGLVLAAVPLVGVSPEDIAAQAAAHAAAAALYEALVAVSSSATDAQKQASQDALQEAQDAADAARNAADDGNAAEAAAQAEIAFQAMQEILGILNSLATINFTFSGSVDASTQSVTATYNGNEFVCPISGGVYTCEVPSLQNAVVNVTGAHSNGQDTQSCEVVMNINGIDSCDIAFAQNCTAPWGATVSDGSQVLAFLNDDPLAPQTCVEQVRQCNDGVLSGSYTFQACTVFCTVPNLVGDNTGKTSDITSVDNKIVAGNFIVGTKTNSGSNPEKVKSQSPSAGSVAQCGSSVNYIYYNK